MTRMASEESAIPRYDLSEDLKRVVRTAQGMASDVEDDSYEAEALYDDLKGLLARVEDALERAEEAGIARDGDA